MQPLWIAVLLAGLGMALLLGWRWASGRWQLPCPSMFGWALESRFYDWLGGTRLTLQRMHLKPGQRILEMGQVQVESCFQPPWKSVWAARRWELTSNPTWSND